MQGDKHQDRNPIKTNGVLSNKKDIHIFYYAAYFNYRSSQYFKKVNTQLRCC